MAATERDGDYERWQAALNSLQEVSGQYHQLLKSVQSGFHTLSYENAAINRRLTQIEGEFRAMHTTFQQLLPHMAAIAAYAVRLEQREQEQRPVSTPRPRQSRRANGE